MLIVNFIFQESIWLIFLIYGIINYAIQYFLCTTELTNVYLQLPAKKSVEYVATTNLDARYSSVDDDAVRLGRDADATNNASVNTEVIASLFHIVYSLWNDLFFSPVYCWIMFFSTCRIFFCCIAFCATLIRFVLGIVVASV